MILVFRAGEYDDGIDGNSTFEEGDWNGDGDFDSSDLVVAFQAANYVAEAVPAPVDDSATIDLIFDNERFNTKRPAYIA